MKELRFRLTALDEINDTYFEVTQGSLEHCQQYMEDLLDKDEELDIVQEYMIEGIKCMQ